MKLAETKRRNALQRVFSSADLNAAWQLERQRLKSSSYGIDRIGGKQFDAERAWRIPSIKERRLTPRFSPHPLLAIAKPKDSGGHRIICVPTIEDRLIQFSLLRLIRDPLKSRGLLNTISYGLVAHSGRTVQDARARAAVLRQDSPWIYKTDIQKFFDRIPRDRLRSEIKRIIPFPTLHETLIAFSEVEIGDGFAPDWQSIVNHAGIREGIGVRQGMPLSPYFAGILLRDLDRAIEKLKLPVIRYVDDIVGFFSSREECLGFDSLLREKLGKLSLSLGAIGEENSKSIIYKPDEPASFVGMEMRFRDDGRCQLFVSEKTMQGVESRIAQMAQIDILLQKK